MVCNPTFYIDVFRGEDVQGLETVEQVVDSLNGSVFRPFRTYKHMEKIFFILNYDLLYNDFDVIYLNKEVA